MMKNARNTPKRDGALSLRQAWGVMVSFFKVNRLQRIWRRNRMCSRALNVRIRLAVPMDTENNLTQEVVNVLAPSGFGKNRHLGSESEHIARFYQRATHDCTPSICALKPDILSRCPIFSNVFHLRSCTCRQPFRNKVLRPHSRPSPDFTGFPFIAPASGQRFPETPVHNAPARRG